MEVLIFDTSGHFDVFEITNVQDDAAHLQHRGQDLSYPYDTGASVTQAHAATYYLDRTTNQLKMYDGGKNDVPIVDNVVDLQFSYFGDPNPPTQPKPPAGTANCLYDSSGNLLNKHGAGDDGRFARGAVAGDSHRRSVLRLRREPVRLRSAPREEGPRDDSHAGRPRGTAWHGHDAVDESRQVEGQR